LRLSADDGDPRLRGPLGRAPARDGRGDRARAPRGPVRLPLPRRGRPSGRRGRLPDVLVLARRRLRSAGTARGGAQPDGRARRPRERRRALLRRDRSRDARVPRQLHPGPDAPRARQRRRLDRESLEVTLWGALVGGLVGTVVLTSGLRIAQELGWTRMDIPLLLGTVFTDSRSRASVF